MADILNNANIYDINAYIDKIKSKYISENDLTLSMGIFGYLGDISSTMMQNSIIMASEFSNEAIPTRAKFNKNILSHAVGYGIDINATPAEINVALVLPKANVDQNLINDTFIWDRGLPITINDLEFHTNYDIEIKRIILTNGDNIYTAMYNINQAPYNGKNSTLEDPYLPPVAIINNNNEDVIIVQCKLYQLEYHLHSSDIINKNPILNKIYEFEYENQLVKFDVDITNYDKPTVNLTPVYTGINNETNVLNYCNYSYLDENKIRLEFNDTSNLPNMNTEIDVHVITTHGSSGNFTYNTSSDPIYVTFQNINYTYIKMYALCIPVSDSQYGIDAKSIDEIKKNIPREALGRGSITNEKDVNNYFNSISYLNTRELMYANKKIDNPLHRMYSVYSALADLSNNIIPSNTIDINCELSDLDSLSGSNYILNAGKTFKDSGNEIYKVVDDSQTKISNAIDNITYFNPFMCRINKSPLFVSYYLNYMDIHKLIIYKWINRNSQIQFILNNIHWYKHYFDQDKNVYNGEIIIQQSVNTDFGLVHYDNPLDPTEITSVDVTPFIVFYKNGKPYRWINFEFVSFDDSTYSYTFRVSMKTTNMLDSNDNIRIEGLNQIGTKDVLYGFMEDSSEAYIGVLVKDNERPSAGYDNTFGNYIDDDSKAGYSLSNVYKVFNNIDFLFDYSKILTSAVKISKSESSGLTYYIKDVPVLGKAYVNTEDKFQKFINSLEFKHIKLDECLNVIEDNFSIDFKLFNTYGKGHIYYIDENTPINNTTLNITFKIKFSVNNDVDDILADIKSSIKNFIEDTSEVGKDLHIPNLITFITDKFKNYITYIEFVDFNGYGPGVQHVFVKENIKDTLEIPEFLNCGNNFDNINIITI